MVIGKSDLKNIMEQHDPAWSDLRVPAGEVMRHRLVRMEAVDVHDIDRVVAEVLEGLIEQHPQQV